jgi:hypothetical protein
MRGVWRTLALGFVLILSSCNTSYSDLEAQAGSWQLLVPAKPILGFNEAPTHSMAVDFAGNPGFIYHRGGFPYSSPIFNYRSGSTWIGSIVEPSTQDSNNWNNSLDIAFDTQNRPVVAFSKWVAGVGGFIYVKRWNPSTGVWKTYAPIGLVNYPNKVELELANNLPVVAYIDGAGNGLSPYVVNAKRLSCATCTTWTDYGTAETNVSDFSLALDEQKNPLLAITKSEIVQSTFQSSLVVKKWNTSTSQWELLGAPLTSKARNLVIATDPNGYPTVLWLELNNTLDSEALDPAYLYVKRWNSTTNAWQSLGTSVTDNARLYYGADMVLDGEGNPYVIWKNELDKALYVKHWKVAENRWRFVGPNPVSNVLGVSVAGNPQIDWKSNNLVVSWEKPRTFNNGLYYNGGIYLKRYVP